MTARLVNPNDKMLHRSKSARAASRGEWDVALALCPALVRSKAEPTVICKQRSV